MPTSITFKSKDDPGNTLNLFDDIKKEIEISTQELKEQINEIGLETLAQMLSIISAYKLRPQSDDETILENVINIEIDENGWGIGDINDLNDRAPYWAAVNFGSSHMVGKRLPPGTFSPGVPNPTDADFRSGRWYKNKTSGLFGARLYSPIVTKEIPAMNYIEKTVDWLNTKLDELKLE